MDWDLSSYFTEFGSPTYQLFKEELVDSIAGLTDRIQTLQVNQIVKSRDWEALLSEVELAAAKYSHLSSYVSCLSSADAQNDLYIREENALAEVEAQVSKLKDKLMRALGEMEQQTFQELVQRDRLETAAYQLKEWRTLAHQRMNEELEFLAADLGVNGLSAWSRLYFTSMGNLTFRYTDPKHGETETPMAQLVSLLSDPDRDRRKAASHGAALTFAEHQHMYAAAINAISGTRLTLNKRRGVTDFLDPSLQQSRIRSSTLEAMMSAIEDRLPFAREVFAFRNHCLGIEDPGYFDLRAPLPLSEGSGPPWEDGVSLISSAFNRIYPTLGTFFDELLQKRWVDYSPRSGKRPGGFCTTSLVTRESRIFMTYKDTLNDIMTLAHEAGHAWHSRILKDARVLASSYPMTLAETASTFAERILTEGVLRDETLEKELKLIILDAEVEHMLAFLLDLPVRFRFERKVYERRSAGSLSPTELSNLMKDTQREVFGDSLAEGNEDPWFWASKLHFYISQVQFYNYPYSFGYLLSTGFMQQFREDGSSALNTYEQFLAKSGSMSCEDVVKETLGEDIGDPNFWGRMIDNLRIPFERYTSLIEELYA